MNETGIFERIFVNVCVTEYATHTQRIRSIYTTHTLTHTLTHTFKFQEALQGLFFEWGGMFVPPMKKGRFWAFFEGV